MTRRERMERRLEKRHDWAESAERKSAAAFNQARVIADGIPLGQPILVGHHSEKRHRRDIARIDSGMRRGVEEGRKAEHHESKAAGIADQLDSSIFSDDGDAIEQLQARIAEREAERDRKKAANAAWKKAGKPAPDAGEAAWLPVAEKVGAELAQLAARSLAHQGRTDSGQWVAYSWAKPFDLTHLGANIRRDQERIEDVKRRQRNQRAAEEDGGVTIARKGDWCVVVFAEKPERAVLNALRAAGYWWGAGCWRGPLAKLPTEVIALEKSPAPAEPAESAETAEVSSDEWPCSDGPRCQEPACVNRKQQYDAEKLPGETLGRWYVRTT